MRVYSAANIIGRVIFYATLLSGFLNTIVFVGAVVALLKQWVGFLGYFLWIFAAPVLSPAALGLPWFVAWVYNEPVNQNAFLIWLSFWVCIALRTLLWKWAPDKNG